MTVAQSTHAAANTAALLYAVNFDKKLNSTPEEDEEATKAKAANTTKKEPVRRGSSFLAAQNAGVSECHAVTVPRGAFFVSSILTRATN
jgi:hypothetical protein